MKFAKYTSSALLASFALVFIGCSERWIDADAGIGSDQIVAEIQAVQGANSVNTLAEGKSTFDDILLTEGAYIYYTDGGGGSVMGPAIVAAGLLDFSFMGDSAADVVAEDLTEAIVVYVEDVDRAALMIQIHPSGSSGPITRYYTSVAAPTFDGDEYTVELGRGGNTILRLSTYNTTDNDLQGVVRFQVYDYTSDGVEQWLGQFGAMVGYF